MSVFQVGLLQSINEDRGRARRCSLYDTDLEVAAEKGGDVPKVQGRASSSYGLYCYNDP